MKTNSLVVLLTATLFILSGSIHLADASTSKEKVSATVQEILDRNKKLEIRGDRKLSDDERIFIEESIQKLRKAKTFDQRDEALETLGLKCAHNMNLPVLKEFMMDENISFRERNAAVMYMSYVISKESVDMLIEITQGPVSEFASEAHYRLRLLGLLDCSREFNDRPRDEGYKHFQRCCKETWEAKRETYEFPKNARYRVMQRL